MAMKDFLRYIDTYCCPVSDITHTTERHKMGSYDIESIIEENETISFSGPMGIKRNLVFMGSDILLTTPFSFRPLAAINAVCKTVPADETKVHVIATLSLVQVFPNIMQPIWYGIETYYFREMAIDETIVDEKVWLNREYGRLHV